MNGEDDLPLSLGQSMAIWQISSGPQSFVNSLIISKFSSIKPLTNFLQSSRRALGITAHTVTATSVQSF